MFESRFQSFDVQSDPGQSKARLAALRAELKRANMDGFIVPRADEHQNEYVPKCAERLRWLTGFTGSAGVAIVLANKAAIFVDGRYTLQARSEVDSELFAIIDITRTPPSSWLAEQVNQCGYCINGWIMTGAELLARKPHPTEAEIREAFADLICRCGTHNAAVKAVKRAAEMA